MSGAGISGARRLLAAGLLASLGFAAPLAVAAQKAPAPLRIVFIAYENPNQLLENVEPVVEYLEERLGREVRHFAATDYAAVVEALKNETADVGFMGPLQYVIAHQEAGAYPILGEIYNGSATYVSRIFVRKDSGIRELEDLRGKTIAFVDPLSSSGYMYPLDTFRAAGLVPDREAADRYFRKIYFAGGDEQAIRAVYNRFVDAAGVGQYSYSLLRPEERDEVVAIADSRPIPSHAVVVRKGLDRALVEGVRSALLALNEGPRRDLLAHLYSVDGYILADDGTYAEVARVAREYGFLRR